jgi:phosphorylase kinase alpha/beta subunit
LAWLDLDLPKANSSQFDRTAFEPANYERFKSFAWSAFYQSSPNVCGNYIVKSLQFLSQLATEPAGLKS